MSFSAEKKVGLLFFLGIALLAVFTILLTDINIFKKQYTISVLFERVGGLKRGDKVALGGMIVGDVKDLVHEQGKIRVLINIDRDIEIPRNSAFKLGDIGLLGGKRVDIIWGHESSGFIQPGDEIIGESSPGLSEAIASLGEAGDSMDQILTSVKDITDKIARGEGTIGKLINEEEMYDEARTTLASVNTASQKLTDLATKAERVRVYIGAEIAYNTRNKHRITKAYIQIEPTPSKLYQIGVSVLAGEGTEAEHTDKPHSEIDAQIGLRFFDNRLTVRAGLLEGRVGGGLDFRIWGEKLVATVEGRDVWTKEKDENIDPFLLRAFVDVHVWWGFYLRLGGDNLLDEPGFYGGAGLKLRDDDIKALFGFITLD